MAIADECEHGGGAAGSLLEGEKIKLNLNEI